MSQIEHRPALDAIAEKVLADQRISPDEALLLLRHETADDAGRAGRPGAPAQARRRRGDVHHRPQHQLHQRLQRLLQFLRVLPRTGLGRGLRAARGDDRAEDPRDLRAWRQSDPAAGRPQPSAQDRLLRRSVPPTEDHLSRPVAARAVAAGGRAHLPRVPHHAGRDDLETEGRGPRLDPRRRGRDSRGPRAAAAGEEQVLRRTSGWP